MGVLLKTLKIRDKYLRGKYGNMTVSQKIAPLSQKNLSWFVFANNCTKRKYLLRLGLIQTHGFDALIDLMFSKKIFPKERDAFIRFAPMIKAA